jgi:cyclopropane-fatty-acyl-phospholipid synthase
MAEHYPASRITAISNAAAQRTFIEACCAARGLRNVDVITCDINTFNPAEFDRVVSVEMFEHVRNYERLLRKVADWLNPAGLLFVHIFAHRQFAYLYEDRGPGDWMARHFFTGGQMPSAHLLLHFQQHLQLMHQWQVGGMHYARTLEAWLERMDASRGKVERLFEAIYGADQVKCWISRWRIFFMACAELFAYHGGREWLVSHYLFQRR